MKTLRASASGRSVTCPTPLLLFFLVLPLAAQTPEVARCMALQHHGDPGTRACYEQLTRSRDRAVQAEGFWYLRNYQAANDAFRDAVKLHDNDPYLRVRWGLMYLEHWQPADANDLFQEALKIKENYAPALVGLARVAADSFEGKAAELAEKALMIDPKLVEARELLARMALEDNNPDKAKEEAGKALTMAPDALDAMAVLASVDLLDDKQTPWIDRILKVNPAYGEAWATPGHFFVINRRYDEGIKAYRKALEIEPTLNSARTELGVNLMRFGQDGEARQQLQAAWDAGYQSNETKNSLLLLDSYKNFKTFETPTTILKLHKKESALLQPYFQAELNRALATYEKKYKFKINGPVQIEVYPDHEDFAVRTMGMPGLGALGVTFGTVVAMDSPSSRTPGSFHWDSTMWHELSHVYVLTMTKSRVPRWFTEGLAVYEETANGHPDWGDRLGPEEIMAIKDKKLLPVAELDRGFIHPTHPQQVIISYFQGGQICNFIDEKWGYDKLLAMIKDFGDLIPTSQVIEKEFSVKPEEFDRQFLAWLEAKTKRTVDGFDDWKKQLKAISEAAKAKKWDDVIKTGEAARDIYPDYVETGSVYEFLTNAYLAKGDKPKAIAELERYSQVGGRDPLLLKQLATLQVEQGHKREAADALQRLNWIYLEDDEAHQKLGELYLDLNNPADAIREFQAVLAGKPIDPAGAHYQLARAYMAVHRTSDAREEVLSSLEAAPGFKPAQKLLLELTSKE